MIKTRISRIKCSPDTKEIINSTSIESARLYNLVKDTHTNEYKSKKVWITENEMMTLCKRGFNLHSQTIQAIIQKFYVNLSETTTHRKNGNKRIKYPYKDKKYWVIPFKASAIKVFGNRVRLSLGNGRKPIWLSLPDTIDKPNTAEIVYKRGKYHLHYTIEVSISPLKTDGVIAGADPGIVHTAAVTDGVNSIVVNGRELRAIRKYRNKTLGILSHKQSKCVKYSPRWKTLQKAKLNILDKSDNKIKDILHKSSRLVANFCNNNSVKTLYIGESNGIRDKDCGRVHNQRLSNWEIGQHFKYVSYKCLEIGTDVKKKEESNSSSICPACGRKVSPSCRIFKCSCGFVFHRDVVGSLNIRSIGIHGVIRSSDVSLLKTPMYLRPLQKGVVNGSDTARSNSGVPEPLDNHLDCLSSAIA
jgi:putative transposase